MKQRVISAVVALAFLGVVLFWVDTVFLNIVIALLGAIAVY